MRSPQSRRKAIFFLILLISASFGFYDWDLPHAKGAGENWLTGYTRRMKITITQLAGASSGYVVPINISLFTQLPQHPALNISTPTSAGGLGEAVHPSILYFPNGWGNDTNGNSWTYWMGFMPLSDGAHENPEVLVSNITNFGAQTWIVPPGCTNPIDPQPAPDVNSDSELVYNATGDLLCYYYRDTIGNSHLNLRTSTNGTTWSAESVLVNWASVNHGLSHAIVIDASGTWYMWIVNNADTRVELWNSTDGITWAKESNCALNGVGAGTKPWHLDVIYVSEYGEYWMALVVADIGGTGVGSHNIFARSTDRINWYTGANQPFMEQADDGSWDGAHNYAGTLLVDSPTVHWWYSAKSAEGAGGTWNLGYDNITIDTTTDDIFNESQANFGDIRITDDTGDTLLDIWADNMSLAEPTFYVELMDDLSADDVIIYLYFGNSTNTAVWDGPATFDFFDDFDDGALNGTLWDDGGTPTEAGDQVTVNNLDYIITDDNFSIPCRAWIRGYIDITVDDSIYFGFTAVSVASPFAVMMRDDGAWTGGAPITVYARSYNTTNEVTKFDERYLDTDHLWEIRLGGDEQNYIVSEIMRANHTVQVLTADQYLAVNSKQANTIAVIDWVALDDWAGAEASYTWTLEGLSANTAPVLGGYTISDWDGDNLYTDGEFSNWWLQATDADGGADIATFEFAFQLGSVWCNVTFTSSTGLWVKDTDSPVTVQPDGQSEIGTTKNALGILAIEDWATPTDNVVVYGRVTDASSATSGWGVLPGVGFNVLEAPEDQGTTGGPGPPPDDGDDDEPEEEPGDPCWWTDPEKLNEMSLEDLRVLADSLDVLYFEDDTKADLILAILNKAEEVGCDAFSGCTMDNEEKLAKLEYLMGLSVQELRLECQSLGISYKLWREPEPYIILIFTVGYHCSPPGYFDPTDWDGDGTPNWDDPDMFDPARMGLGARVEDIHLEASLPWIKTNGYVLIILLLVFAFLYSQVKKKDKPGSRGESLIRPRQGGYLPGERNK